MRKEARLTQKQVADELEWSPSKLIRVEGGHSSITKVDLNTLLTLYGVSSDIERTRLQELNRGAREKGWWDEFKEIAAKGYLNFVGYEAGAAFIRQYTVSTVPSLLQTSGYADALNQTSTDDQAQVNQIAALVMRRQKEMARRADPPRQYYLLDESVVRRPAGAETNAAIMTGQLRHIVDAARRNDRLTVRLIPFLAGAHAGSPGPFTLLEFDGVPNILYLEADRDDLTMVPSDDARVSDYHKKFELLLERALTEEESAVFIEDAAEEMSKFSRPHRPRHSS
jgi:transcriptional regulator with XRE-family HTH domain